MRTSDVAVTNIFRDVSAGKLILATGITVTKDVRMARHQLLEKQCKKHRCSWITWYPSKAMCQGLN
ncbi:hypothetical protein F4823DRAFT_596262 [Ustulina deusta]|nr:hypothetical protein F4823DRAFT_596262 [Ustulina deusta]